MRRAQKLLQSRKKRARLFSALLAWSLTLSLVSPAALAADTDKTVSVDIATGIQDTPSAEIQVPWEDAWFAEDASVYNSGLAAASMALSGAAYIKDGKLSGVQDAMKALGFGSLKSYNYQLSLEAKDRTAYTFGVKKVKNQDGESVKLVAVVVRGTGEYTEWASNLNVGTGSVHQGFSKARDELLENLEKYLSKQGISGKSKDTVKFLVTGHSRGGAVANLVSAYLVDAALAESGNVYGYTFAAPAVSTEAEEEGYENIFNIINEEDLVTLVPLSQWGYRRYGVDLPLPTKENCGDAYDGIFSEMDQCYTDLTGQPYAAYQTPAAAQEMAAALYRLIPTVDGVNMAMLSALLSGDLDGLSDLVNQNSLAALTMGRTALELSSELTPLLQLERDAMVSAHCMAGYYSWLTAVSEAGEA